MLYEAFSDGEDISEFSLEDHVKQVCLEPGDRIPEGLESPEYVERVFLGDSEMYRMYVLDTEDSGTIYYSIVGTLEEVSERFLKEQEAMGER